MKTKLLMLIAVLTLAVSAQAQKYAQIKFEKTTIDMGTFSMDSPVRKCVFKFTNVGDAKLVITSVQVSCGCTVADYPKDFIAPGASGEISVTYNGQGKMPGKFNKNIRVYSNSKEEMTRLFIKGDMTDVPTSKKDHLANP